MDVAKVAEALLAAGFTLAGRSRGGERYHWPGDNHPRSASLFVSTDGYPEELRQNQAALLAELRRAVEIGDAARAVLLAVEPRAICGETNHRPCAINAGMFGGQHKCHRSPDHGLFVLHLCSCGEEFHVALDVCKHCGDRTEPGDDPAPDLCEMCAKAERT
jgi:hypothetical protein